MNKKGIALGFLVTLILGLLIFGSTAFFFSRCFRLSDKGLESYEALVENIQAMEKKVEGEIEAHILIMDKETALIGFTKESELVQFDASIGGDSYFERPAQCAENKSCLCLCREGFGDKELFDAWNIEVICETSILCNSFENIDFPSKISSEDFGLAHPQSYEFRGGFMFTRKRHGFTTIPKMEIGTREKAIYLERYKEGVALCFDPPCFKQDIS